MALVYMSRYIICFLWIMTIVYICRLYVLFSLDSDCNIHFLVLISVFSGK